MPGILDPSIAAGAELQVDSGAAPRVDHITALVDGNVLYYDQASGKFKGQSLLALPAGAADKDLFYYNGSGYSRIPVGSNGQQLVVSGGTPAWAGGSGSGAPNGPWAPTGAIAENFTRVDKVADAYAPISGELTLAGGMVLPANVPVNSITLAGGSGGLTTPTHQWFCLVDQALNVLAKTVDDLTTAWGAFSKKTLALSAAYTPSVATPVYVGCLITAASTGNLIALATNTTMHQSLPMIAGRSTTGLTTPGSLGATAGAPSIASANPYCYVS